MSCKGNRFLPTKSARISRAYGAMLGKFCYKGSMLRRPEGRFELVLLSAEPKDLRALTYDCLIGMQYAYERGWGKDDNVLKALMSANKAKGFDWCSVSRGDWREELLKHNIDFKNC